MPSAVYPPTLGNTDPGFMGTVGLAAANATAVTAAVLNTSYFQYIGRASVALASLDVTVRVTTAAVAAITWAEIGVFKGAPVANGAATLTRLGFTDVSAVFNANGIFKTTIALSGMAAADDLWLAYGSNAAVTGYQLRGMVVDDIQSGALQEKAATRISTVAAATLMSLSAASLVPAWMVAKV